MADNLKFMSEKTQDNTVNSYWGNDPHGVFAVIWCTNSFWAKNADLKRQIDHNMWIIRSLAPELCDFYRSTGNCVNVDTKDMEIIELKIEVISNLVEDVWEIIDETEHKILNYKASIAHPLGE